MKIEYKVIVLSIFFGLFVGLIDASVDYFIFYEKPFWDLLLFEVPRYEVYMRSLVLVIFVIFGLIISRILTKLREAEEVMRESSRELNIRNRIAQIFLTTMDENVYGDVLQVILEATGSPYGFIGYIDEQGALVCPSMTREVWDKCHIPDKGIVFPRDKWGEIWGRALIEKKTLYSNRPFRVPDGHIPIFRALTVPIVHQDEAIGNITVANRETDYDEDDRELLETISDYISPILNGILEVKKQESRGNRAESAASRSELLRHAAFNSIQEGVFVLTSDRTILEVNGAGAKMLGYSRDELLNKSAQVFHVDHEHYVEFGGRIREALDRGKVAQLEFRLRRSDGEIFPTEHTISPILKRNGGEPDRIVSVIRDISDRKQAEEALRESEERYRELFENESDAIMIFDAETLQFEDANTATLDLFGYSKEEFLALRVTDISAEEEKTKTAVAKLRVSDSGKLRVASRQFRKKDGTIFPGEISAGTFVSGGGKKGIGAVRDITGRQKAEEALRESEERYRNLSEVTLEGIAFHDQGVLLDINTALARMLGYDVEELIGKNVIEIFPLPEYRDIVREKVVSDYEQPYEIMARRKDGTIFPVEIEGREARYKGKTLRVASVRDITERKKAEEGLRKSEERYRILVERMGGGMSALNEKSEFTYVNDRLCEMCGYSREEMIGHKVKDFLDEANQNVFDGQFAARKKGKAEPFEMVWTRKDGEKIYTIMSPTPLLDENGAFKGSFAVTTDITERKKLEGQLLQAQKMEAIGTLAGGIAHDFNNLLMAIQGNASLMLFDIDDEHKHYRMLKNIEEQVRSGATLTHQLLGYARKGKYEVKPINLNRLVKQTSETFGRAKKEIAVRRELAEDLLAVEADQSQMEQVLLNLYLNAADAMPDGGDLYLGTTNVTPQDIKGELHEAKPGKYVLLTVTDAGSGMDRETKARIFDPFFTTKEIGEGTGLGLASAYGIIKNHGGYIRVDSQEGRGTTFRIYLPASEKKVPKALKRAEQIIQGTGTILLVDDEVAVLDVGVDLLRILGYQVIAAKSGKEAIEIYKADKDKIDLVILDIIMPEMGGGDTYDRLKEINPDIKVLLSSGYTLDERAEEILEQGGQGFIQKPFNAEKLSGKIREVLDKK